MTLQSIKWVLIALMLFLSWLFIRTLLRRWLEIDIVNAKSKRLNQLDSFTSQKAPIKTNEEQMKELIENITKPVISHILPKFKKFDSEKLERELRLVGWHQYFTPEQFRALSIFLKILGVVALLLLLPIAPQIGIIWFAALAFFIDFGFKGSVDDKYQKLLIEFPDLIEVIQGYISAGYTFEQAAEQVLPVTNTWRPILKEFLIVCQYEDLNAGLNYIKRTVDVFEIREFCAVLQLGMEQGMDIADNLENQANKIEELKDVMFEKKLVKRQSLAIVVQGPLLIMILFAFGLPTIYQALNMGL